MNVMFNATNLPKGATHYMLWQIYTKAGGTFGYEFYFFKLKDGQWFVYQTDTDNEYPRWCPALNCFRVINPTELLPVQNDIVEAGRAGYVAGYSDGYNDNALDEFNQDAYANQYAAKLQQGTNNGS